MPAFIETLINPFRDLFSYIGIPVLKSKSNSFIDQEIKADVQQVGEIETPAKVMKIVDPNGNSNYMSAINRTEHFECEPEIPILFINKDAESFIWRSNGDKKNEFQSNQYTKVSQVKVKNKLGFDTTLDQLLKDLSQATDNNAPKRYRPIPILVQAGQNTTILNPVTNNNDTFPANLSACTQCDDDSLKTRPHFPLYAPGF